VEDQEPLHPSALIRKLPDAIQRQIDDFLADSVVSACVIVSGVFLTVDDLLRVEQLAISASTDFIDDGRLKVDEDSTRDVLACTSLREESVEGVVTDTDGFVRGHLTVGLDAMLKAVELPATIADLDTGLACMDGDDFTHC
jgi:hypothetical protein